MATTYQSRDMSCTHFVRKCGADELYNLWQVLGNIPFDTNGQVAYRDKRKLPVLVLALKARHEVRHGRAQVPVRMQE